MPFHEKVRSFVNRAVGNQCIGATYSETHGFQRCKEPSWNVHHIQPEAWVLAGNEDFFDPNQSDAAPLCMTHHTLKHPELAEVKESYRSGNKDAYKDMAHEHHTLAQQGVIYWNTDSDEYLIQQSRELIQRYVTENPTDKKPSVKPHKDTKPHHWYDGIFD